MLLAKKNAKIADNNNPVITPKMVHKPGFKGVVIENQSFRGNIRVPVTDSGTRTIEAMNRPIKNGLRNVGNSTGNSFRPVFDFFGMLSLGIPVYNIG